MSSRNAKPKTEEALTTGEVVLFETGTAKNSPDQSTQLETRIKIIMKNPDQNPTEINSFEEQPQNAIKMTEDQPTAKPD